MRFFYALMAVCTVMLASCSGSFRDTALFEKTGQMKPIVVVMPVINHMRDPKVTWDYSREFTDEIRKRVYDSSKLYLLKEGGNLELAKALNAPDPVSIPKEATEALGAAEYVVVTELLDQKQVNYGMGETKPYLEEVGGVLSLSARVRVIDVRKEEPRVILQEIIDHDHVIPKTYLSSDYAKSSWGTEAYQRTPMGIVHSKVIRELCAHVEGYIVAAR